MSNTEDSVPDTIPDTIPEAEEEQDEEVRIAMEMALAAAKNPGLTPAQLRELVGNKNKQADIVDQVKKEKEQKAKEEATKRWTEKKESFRSWFSETTNKIRATAESLQSSAEQQIYAEKIKKDPEVIRLRKKIKHLRKDFKAKRLSGNRVETRHRFKRHRMESHLLTQEERVEKARKLFVDTNYGLQEYGKAILRAGRKYKNGGSKEEEILESQLCRNMHQMLSIDKQKAKMKKSNKEIKKYLQRCESWISDKQNLWEMNVMKIDATHASMKALYEDTLSRQDKLIQKLQAAEDLKDVDIGDVDVSCFDAIPENAGPRGMLCALRGLPFTDSIRVTKSSSGASVSRDNRNGGRKELIIETGDCESVHSHLSDPDADGENDFESSVSAETGFGFGDDAPWNLGDTSISPSKRAAAAEAQPKKQQQPSMKEGLMQPPSTITAPTPVVVVENMKPAPTPPAKEPVVTETPKEPVAPPEEDEESPIKAEDVSETFEKADAVESLDTTPASTVSAEA